MIPFIPFFIGAAAAGALVVRKFKNNQEAVHIQFMEPNLISWVEKEFPELKISGHIDPNLILPNREPLLVHLYRRMRYDYFKLLLELGANPNSSNSDGSPILNEVVLAMNKHNKLHSVMNGMEECFNALLAHHVDPNRMDAESRTALFYAQTANIVNVLIQNGADPNAQDIHGRTAIFYATRLDVLEELLKNDAEPNIRDAEGKTFLFTLEFGDLGARALALCWRRYGGDFAICDNEGNLAPFSNSFLECKKYNHKFDKELDRAVDGGTVEEVRVLLEKGADPNIHHSVVDNWNMLILAMYRKKHDVLTLLLAAGADPNFITHSGSTISYAIYYNDPDSLEILLQYGSIPDRYDYENIKANHKLNKVLEKFPNIKQMMDSKKM